MVPETLLKKRKSQEKERESRAAETHKRRKVRRHSFLSWAAEETMVMINTDMRLVPRVNVAALLTIFRD